MQNRSVKKVQTVSLRGVVNVGCSLLRLVLADGVGMVKRSVTYCSPFSAFDRLQIIAIHLQSLAGQDLTERGKRENP
jgi:hypothetical protein